ncbi:MAG: hypothetical protein V4718_00270 [Pseudomonadota bacterium]
MRVISLEPANAGKCILGCGPAFSRNAVHPIFIRGSGIANIQNLNLPATKAPEILRILMGFTNHFRENHEIESSA